MKSKTETVDPKRAKLRSESVDPTLKQSKSDTLEPSREKLRRESDDPT